MDTDEILAVFRDSGALLEGHFELRSGLHSNRFVQCAHVLRYPRRAAALCRELALRVQAVAGDAPLAGVISPALGGIIVGQDVARALAELRADDTLKAIFAEKQDGVLVLRRFAIEPGERYVVAEDVVTRGGRVQETIDIVRQAGGEVAAIGLLVDRSGGKASFDAPTVSLIRMEPITWEPALCPLCEEGVALVHPGS